MRVVCYEMAPEGHWSDRVLDDEGNEFPGRPRYRRTRILSAAVAPSGLTVSGPGNGSHCVIPDRNGALEVAARLPAVWHQSEVPL